MDDVAIMDDVDDMEECETPHGVSPTWACVTVAKGIARGVDLVEDAPVVLLM